MSQQLKKGVIELIILQLLSNKEYYGYELSQYINEYIEFKESSIYIILSRLEQHGLIDVRKDRSKINNKMVKFYKINNKGEEYFNDMMDRFNEINALLEDAKSKGERNER